MHVSLRHTRPRQDFRAAHFAGTPQSRRQDMPTAEICAQLFSAITLTSFGDFGVSFAATVAGRYTRRGDSRLSVQGEPLIVLTREP